MSDRRRGSLPVLLLLLLLLTGLLPVSAVAQEGREITGKCHITMPGRRAERNKAFDRKYKSAWTRMGTRATHIEIALPKGTKQGGVYLCFAKEPKRLRLLQGKDETLLHESEGPGFAHQYIPFEGNGRLLLEMEPVGKEGMAISELYVFSGEQPPDWVQRWQPRLERADLLVLVAHPDDELLWMGGAIPFYAQERGKDVAVAYMTCANAMRRSEMLNGLWAAGIRHYPYIGAFRDKRMPTMRDSWRIWGGEEHVTAHVADLYRRLKPQVVISHDLKGEYGHPAHIITARAATAALEAAADATRFPQSAAAHGTWDVPKLYLHLYEDNALEIDWRRPIAAMGGKTALAICEEAFQQHRSQRANFAVKVDGKYSAARFGLYRTLVGLDRDRDDFFENIPPIEMTGELPTPVR